VESWFYALTYALAAYGLFQAVLGLLARACRHYGPPSQRPKLSIVVVMRDKEQVIEGFIRSLLNFRSFSSRADYDVVVVDDGSSDASAKIIERLSRRYANLRIAKMHDTRVIGVSSALEAGVFLARSTVVIVCDARAQFDPKHTLGKLLCLLDGSRHVKPTQNVTNINAN